MGVIDDPVANRMLPPGWPLVARMLRAPGARRLGASTFAYLAARTLFYDSFVQDAVRDGIRQVVVVAAGYDSRASRFARPGVDFYEIDLPPTQADKRLRAPDGAAIYVPADVTEPAMVDELTGAGFVAQRPTAFTVEGLTMYLSEHDVRMLLRRLADLGGPGSRLAVNFGVGFERQGSDRGRMARQVMTAGGEQFRFRMRPEHATEFLARAGWTVDALLSAPQLRERYLMGTALERARMTSSGFAVAATLAT
jgi:methyltransferase (TIGR00027 family)